MDSGLAVEQSTISSPPYRSMSICGNMLTQSTCALCTWRRYIPLCYGIHCDQCCVDMGYRGPYECNMSLEWLLASSKGACCLHFCLWFTWRCHQSWLEGYLVYAAKSDIHEFFMRLTSFDSTYRYQRGVGWWSRSLDDILCLLLNQCPYELWVMTKRTRSWVQVAQMRFHYRAAELTLYDRVSHRVTS